MGYNQETIIAHFFFILTGKESNGCIEPEGICSSSNLFAGTASQVVAARGKYPADL